MKPFHRAVTARRTHSDEVSMTTDDVGLASDERPVRLVRKEVVGAGIGVGVADTREGLSAIRRPGCAAAIWRRQPQPSFQAWVDGLDPQALPHGRVTSRPEALRPAVLALCENCGTPDGAMRQCLIDDIAELATLFASLVGTALVKMRLEAVASNACSKFHIDAVTARLICTYRGTGTQYGIITEGDAPRRIFTVPTGAPVILRGTLWPQSPRSGVLHRSPPIEGTGERRLVLVLDPATDPDHRGQATDTQ